MALRQATTEEVQKIKGTAPSISPTQNQSQIIKQQNTGFHPTYSKLRVETPANKPNIQPIKSENDVKGGFVGKLLTGNTQKFGKTIGESLALKGNVKQYEDVLNSHTNLQSQLIKAIGEKKKLGQDTAKLEEVLQEHIKSTPKVEEYTGDVINKTPGQVIGEGIGTGLEALSGGLLEGAGKTIASKTLSTGQKLAQGAKVGATFGSIGSGSQALQENLPAEKVIGRTLGGAAIGAGIGIATEGIGTGLGKIPNILSREGRQGIVNKTIDKGVDELLTKTRGIQNKAKELSSRKNVDIKSIISEPSVFNGLKVSKGQVDPTEAVDVLQNRIDSAMEAKTKLLPELDNKVPKIQKETIREKALNDVRGKYSPADEQDIIRDIDKQLNALPNEFTPSEADNFRARFRKSARDAKGIQKRNSEYSSLENAFRDSVFDVTDNLPFDTNGEYAQLNKFIKDNIEAKDFLDKTVRGQIIKGGRLQNYLARGIGAIAGSQGGILGSLLGSEAAGAVSNIILNNQLGSSVKMKLIREIVDDPAILKQIEGMIQKTQKYNPLETLALPPAPTQLGGKGSTRPDTSGVQIIPATKNPVSINPKTGKFQTSYSSTPNISRQNIANNIPASVNKTGISNTISQPLKKVQGETLPTKPSRLTKRQGGFATIGGFKNEGDLTTKILKDLEGKTTVSKQYILDATNRGELKQVERDITRQVLDTMPDGQINVQEFADKVKAELLPLKVKTTSNPKGSDPKFFREQTRGDAQYGGARMQPRYEMVNLPDELRGNVKNYRENIYESPIKTSAGETHFGGKTDNYFGHTRIEDMADNKTRRVIEVQSDLYQKGNLEKEVNNYGTDFTKAEARYRENNGIKADKKLTDLDMERINDLIKQNQGVAKLQQYNDPTAHFRMIREEIKKAAQDGKTKLQFPTGETAMKIEGLGDNTQWRRQSTYARNNYHRLTTDDLKVGANVNDGNTDWIITDVLGDGKFKAVPKDKIIEYQGTRYHWRNLPEKAKNLLDNASETFDISGKVDTNNPIYKFYEKDVQKYLNKYGGKRVVDDKGVSWIEVPIKKEYAKEPVLAFGKAEIGSLPLIAGYTGALAVGSAAYKKYKESLKK